MSPATYWAPHGCSLVVECAAWARETQVRFLSPGLEKHLRVCKDCGKEKPLEAFASAGKVKGVQYHRWRCKLCYYKFKLIRRAKIKAWYFWFRKTLECSECGNKDHRVLEHHHPNDDKLYCISDMVLRGFSIKKIKRELVKCICLCANCHRILTYEDWYQDLQ